MRQNINYFLFRPIKYFVQEVVENFSTHSARSALQFLENFKMPIIQSVPLFWILHIDKADEIRNYALLKVLVFNFDNNNLGLIRVDLRCRFRFIIGYFILLITRILLSIIFLSIFSLATFFATFATALTTLFLISLLLTTVLFVVTSFATALTFKIGIFFFLCCLSDSLFILLLLYDFVSQIVNLLRARLTLFLSLLPIICSVIEHVLYQ